MRRLRLVAAVLALALSGAWTAQATVISHGGPPARGVLATLGGAAVRPGARLGGPAVTRPGALGGRSSAASGAPGVFGPKGKAAAKPAAAAAHPMRTTVAPRPAGKGGRDARGAGLKAR